MSEQDNQSPQLHQRELSDADAIIGKRILFSVAFIGGVLLVALALPSIMERF